jgi:hypothetical protein
MTPTGAVNTWLAAAGNPSLVRAVRLLPETDLFLSTQVYCGASDSVNGQGAILKTGMSRVRIAMRSLKIPTLAIPSSRAVSRGSIQPQT